MRVIIFGGTGMVGQAALLECLDDPDVSAVLAVGRRAAPQVHPKLTQLVRPDLFSLADDAAELTGYDACLFCLGVSSVGMKEPEYRHLTFDLTLAVAEVLAPANPEMAFLYVSGVGTDSTEKGRVMWARVKGATENALLALPFKGYAIRPGFIQPERGVQSKTRLYAALYRLTNLLFPLLRRVAARHVITSTELGRAMITVARERPDSRVWDSVDLVALARPAR